MSVNLLSSTERSVAVPFVFLMFLLLLVMVILVAVVVVVRELVVLLVLKVVHYVLWHVRIGVKFFVVKISENVSQL